MLDRIPTPIGVALAALGVLVVAGCITVAAAVLSGGIR